MRRKYWLQRIFMIVWILCMVCGTVIGGYAEDTSATTMRLTKAQGTVSVTNRNGRDMGVQNDMKLFHGYHLTTADVSYAWIDLDASKLLKVDAVSEVEVRKKDKQLEILLNSGNLFFNVSESLKSDETLQIRTSTMLTGIRGTSGCVKVLDGTKTLVYTLSGRMECLVTDPVSGQTKSIILTPGDRAIFVAYEPGRQGDKCDIIIDRVREDNIDGFVAVELYNDPEWRQTVENTLPGIDWDTVAKHAESNLVKGEQEIKTELQVVREQSEQQNQEEMPGSSSAGAVGGTQEEPEEDTSVSSPVDPPEDTPDEEGEEITLTVAEVDQLAGYLADSNVKRVNIVTGTEEPTLAEMNITSAITIQEGQTVTLMDGVGLSVAESGTLTVNGTLKVTDSGRGISNYGVIKNTSMNSIDVAGGIFNNGKIDNSGKIQVGISLICASESILNNTGRIIGTLSVNGGSVSLGGEQNGFVGITAGSMEMDGGTLSGGLSITGEGTTVTVTGGTISATSGQHAIYLNATPSNGSGSGAANVKIEGGVIQAENGSALHVVKGVALIDQTKSPRIISGENGQRIKIESVPENPMGTGDVYIKSASGEEIEYKQRRYEVNKLLGTGEKFEFLRIGTDDNCIADLDGEEYLTLYDDIECGTPVTMIWRQSDGMAGIDLNGHTVTISNTLTLGEADGTQFSVGIVNGTLNVEKLVVQEESWLEMDSIYYWGIATDGTYDAENHGTWSMENVYFTPARLGIMNYSTAKMDIAEGGIIHDASGKIAILKAEGATVTIAEGVTVEGEAVETTNAFSLLSLEPESEAQTDNTEETSKAEESNPETTEAETTEPETTESGTTDSETSESEETESSSYAETTPDSPDSGENDPLEQERAAVPTAVVLLGLAAVIGKLWTDRLKNRKER